MLVCHFDKKGEEVYDIAVVVLVAVSVPVADDGNDVILVLEWMGLYKADADDDDDGWRKSGGEDGGEIKELISCDLFCANLLAMLDNLSIFLSS